MDVEKKNINTFFSTKDINTINENVPFQNGEIIRIIKTGEIGVILRSRILGNTIQKTVVIKLETNAKKIIDVTEIEKINPDEDD